MNRQKRKRSSPPPTPPLLPLLSSPEQTHQHILPHQAKLHPHPLPDHESGSNFDPESDASSETSREWCAIKRILDGRVGCSGGTEYLVDWEPFEDQDEKDDPEWVPEHYVTEEAIRRWQKSAAKRKKDSERRNTPHTQRPTYHSDPDDLILRHSLRSETRKHKRQKLDIPELLVASTDDGQSAEPETPSTAGFANTRVANGVVIELSHNSEIVSSEPEVASQATTFGPSQESVNPEPERANSGPLFVVQGDENINSHQVRIIPDSQNHTQQSIFPRSHRLGHQEAEPFSNPNPLSSQPGQPPLALSDPPLKPGAESSKCSALQDENLGPSASIDVEEETLGGEGPSQNLESRFSPAKPPEGSSVQASGAEVPFSRIPDSNPEPPERDVEIQPQPGSSTSSFEDLTKKDPEKTNHELPAEEEVEPRHGSRASFRAGDQETTNSGESTHEKPRSHETEESLPEASSQGPSTGFRGQAYEQPGSEFAAHTSQAAQAVDAIGTSQPYGSSLSIDHSTHHQESSPTTQRPSRGLSTEVENAAPCPREAANIDRIMDNAVTDMPLSAVEELRRMQEQAYGHSLRDDTVLPSSTSQPMELGPVTISPADIMPPTAADQAATFMSQAPVDIPMSSISAMSQLEHDSSLNIGLVQDPDSPRATVSPADINLAMRAGALAVTSSLNTAADATTASLRQPENTASPTPSDDMGPSLPSHLAPAESQIQTEYLVTLPFQASRRAVYINLHSEHQQALQDINNLCTSDSPATPDPDLLAKIDLFLDELLNVCDLPDMITGLHKMPYQDQKMHAVQTNCKFSFIYELLQHIRTFDRTVLIICREGPVFDLLSVLLETAGCKFIVHEEKEAVDGLEDPTIILVSSDQDGTGITTDLDCVVEFDNSCRNSELARQVRTIRNSEGRFPLVLTLVVSYSLEHIYQIMSPPGAMDELLYKSALTIALYNCLPFLKNPRRGYHEPPELGITFGELLRNPDNDIDWSPTQIPDDVFDVFSSQASGYSRHNTQREDSIAPSMISRKRQHDDVDDDSSKRVRLVMRDGISQTDSIVSTEVRDLRAKNAALQASVDKKDIVLKAKGDSESWYKQRSMDLGVQLESNRKTIRRTAKQYHAALKDRGIFEQEAKMALEKQKAAEKAAEAENTRSAALAEKNSFLEKHLEEMRTLMTGVANPEAARLATLEKALKEAEDKVAKAERSAQNARTDLEFAREQYQNASKAASELAIKNDELETENKDLKHKSSDNLRQIHEMNNGKQLQEMRRMLQEREVMIRDRDNAIRKLEETLVGLRMNQGRRETRQNSVPRSPRLGVISPRPVGSRTVAGGSRGGSPAPGGGGYDMGVPGTGGGRWTHLRD